MSFIAPWVELIMYIYQLLTHGSIHENFLEAVFFVIVWPLHYVLFVLVLLFESIFMRTKISLQPCDDNRNEFK